MFENTCDIWRAGGDEGQDYGLLRCGVVCLIDGTNVSEEPKYLSSFLKIEAE
jgi:hypothetical protein